jgi:DNA-binding NtrC family response regulator
MKRILIMDDDTGFTEIFQERLEMEFFEVIRRDDCVACVQEVKEHKPDMVFLDIDFGQDEKKRAGVEALKSLRQCHSKESLPIIMLSGTGDARVLANTLKAGANDYYFKPVEDFSVLIGKINQLLNDQGGSNRTAAKKEEEPVLGGKSQMIMLKNKEIIDAAHAGIDTLFQGESGTGKEVAARLYHEHSSRKQKDMVVINCPGIPSELFESEVFGYNKGAFGNATKDHAGMVEQADQGIIFFDEIGHLSLAHQTKLLRFVQFKTFKRLGCTSERKVDTIILAATSVRLKEKVEQGLFLSELYHRFGSNVIDIPPLRERKEDIAYLAEWFLEKYNNKQIKAIDEEVISVFQQMKWEGNVRQLENCIRNAIHRCKRETLGLKDVAGYLTESDLSVIPKQSFDYANMSYDQFATFMKTQNDTLKKQYYTHHLEQNDWNISQTAKQLGMAKEFLRQIMLKLEIRK